MTNLEYLTNNETKALLRAIKAPRDLAIIQLILGAGLFLNEIPGLNINSIDWEKKILHVNNGSRKRDIPINEELYDALVAWSHERIDNQSKALFIRKVWGLLKKLRPYVVRSNGDSSIF